MKLWVTWSHRLGATRAVEALTTLQSGLNLHELVGAVKASLASRHIGRLLLAVIARLADTTLDCVCSSLGVPPVGNASDRLCKRVHRRPVSSVLLNG